MMYREELLDVNELKEVVSMTQENTQINLVKKEKVQENSAEKTDWMNLLTR